MHSYVESGGYDHWGDVERESYHCAKLVRESGDRPDAVHCLCQSFFDRTGEHSPGCPVSGHASAPPLTLPTGKVVTEESEFGPVNFNNEPLDDVSRKVIRLVMGDRVVTEEMLRKALASLATDEEFVEALAAIALGLMQADIDAAALLLYEALKGE